MFRLAVSSVVLSAALSAQGLGVFYTLTNDSNNNAVVVGASFGGEIAQLYRTFTGGKGTGSNLGSQGALATDSTYLVAVNAGSNSVALFRRSGLANLAILDVQGTGGQRPTSVDLKRDLVYVLNADSDDLTGFRIVKGALTRIGRYPLSGSGVAGAQVGFHPSGRYVIVTERATNQILVYPVRRDGSLAKPAVNKSAAPTPFGFMFRRNGVLVVSEAARGEAGLSAVSSYEVIRRGGGRLAVLTAALGTMQTAACWVGVTPNGRFAYTANTPSSSLTGVSIGKGGKLALLNPDGVTARLDPSARPFDLQFNRSGHLLFVLDSGNDEVIALYRNAKGALVRIPGSVKLPDGAAGLVAH